MESIRLGGTIIEFGCCKKWSSSTGYLYQLLVHHMLVSFPSSFSSSDIRSPVASRGFFRCFVSLTRLLFFKCTKFLLLIQVVERKTEKILREELM